MSKDNYELSGKRTTQKLIFADITNKTFVGLCGSTPMGYLEVINWKRFNKIYLIEKDIKVYLKVKDILGDTYPNVTIVHGDISDYLTYKDAFYDFDFCRTIAADNIDPMMYKLSKIKECSFTFCVRKIGTEATNRKMRRYFPKFNYISSSYRDGAPMICYRIFNVKD